MSKYLLVPFMMFFIQYPASGQNDKFNGKPIAEIFTDFHVSINDTADHTGFAVNRAYLGYQFMPEGKFSGKIIINAGSPKEISVGSVRHRFAYFREASIAWTDQKVIITMGITSTKLFDFQQTFWGKRYIANTYQSINGYGFVADLGITAEYKVNDVLQADLILMNGEGFNELQIDNSIRVSAGLTLTPSNGIALRVLGDIQKKDNLWQPLMITFIGFKNDLITIGGEISFKANMGMNKGSNAWGISATGGINLTQKIELFTRFDYSTSAIIPGDSEPWNYENDGSFIITGLQYTFSPNVKAALDYQGVFPSSTEKLATNLIFLNALFKF